MIDGNQVCFTNEAETQHILHNSGLRKKSLREVREQGVGNSFNPADSTFYRLSKITDARCLSLLYAYLESTFGD